MWLFLLFKNMKCTLTEGIFILIFCLFSQAQVTAQDVPQKVVVKSGVNNSIIVTWLPPRLYPSSDSFNFIVFYQGLTGNNPKAGEVLVTSPNEKKVWVTVLEGLPIKTKYKIEVATVIRRQPPVIGPKSPPLLYQHHGFISEISLNAVPLASDTVLVRLDTVGDAVVDKLRVLYSNNSAICWTRIEDFDKKKRYGIVTGLKPRSHYYFMAKARVSFRPRQTVTHVVTPSNGGRHKPYILDRLPEKVEVERGEDVNLTCHAWGEPMPRVQWYRNNRPVFAVQLTDNILQYSENNVLKSYKMKCRAWNLHGSDVKTVRVVVRAPFQSPILTSHMNRKIQKYFGESLVIPCVFQGNPTPSVTWYNDSQPLTQPSLSSNTLVLPSVTESMFLKCLAENEAGIGGVKVILDVLQNETPSLGLELTEIRDTSFKYQLMPSGLDPTKYNYRIVLDEIVPVSGPRNRLNQLMNELTIFTTVGRLRPHSKYHIIAELLTKRNGPVVNISHVFETANSGGHRPAMVLRTFLQSVGPASDTTTTTTIFNTEELNNTILTAISSTTDTTSSTTDTSSSTVDTTSSTVDTTSSTIDTTSKTIGTTSSTTDITSSTTDTSSSTVDTTSSTVDTTSSTIDTTSKTIDTTSSTIDIASSTIDTTSSTIVTNSSKAATLSEEISALSTSNEANEATIPITKSIMNDTDTVSEPREPQMDMVISQSDNVSQDGQYLIHDIHWTVRNVPDGQVSGYWLRLFDSWKSHVTLNEVLPPDVNQYQMKGMMRPNKLYYIDIDTLSVTNVSLATVANMYIPSVSSKIVTASSKPLKTTILNDQFTTPLHSKEIIENKQTIILHNQPSTTLHNKETSTLHNQETMTSHNQEIASLYKHDSTTSDPEAKPNELQMHMVIFQGKEVDQDGQRLNYVISCTVENVADDLIRSYVLKLYDGVTNELLLNETLLSLVNYFYMRVAMRFKRLYYIEIEAMSETNIPLATVADIYIPGFSSNPFRASSKNLKIWRTTTMHNEYATTLNYEENTTVQTKRFTTLHKQEDTTLHNQEDTTLHKQETTTAYPDSSESYMDMYVSKLRFGSPNIIGYNIHWSPNEKIKFVIWGYVLRVRQDSSYGDLVIREVFPNGQQHYHMIGTLEIGKSYYLELEAFSYSRMPLLRISTMFIVNVTLDPLRVITREFILLDDNMVLKQYNIDLELLAVSYDVIAMSWMMSKYGDYKKPIIKYMVTVKESNGHDGVVMETFFDVDVRMYVVKNLTENREYIFQLVAYDVQYNILTFTYEYFKTPSRDTVTERAIDRPQENKDPMQLNLLVLPLHRNEVFMLAWNVTNDIGHNPISRFKIKARKNDVFGDLIVDRYVEGYFRNYALKQLDGKYYIAIAAYDSKAKVLASATMNYVTPIQPKMNQRIVEFTTGQTTVAMNLKRP